MPWKRSTLEGSLVSLASSWSQSLASASACVTVLCELHLWTRIFLKFYKSLSWPSPTPSKNIHLLKHLAMWVFRGGAPAPWQQGSEGAQCVDQGLACWLGARQGPEEAWALWWTQFLHDASSSSIPMPSPGLETLALSRNFHPRPSPCPYTSTSTCRVPRQDLIDLRLLICLMSLLPRRPSWRAEVLYYLAGLAAGR